MWPWARAPAPGIPKSGSGLLFTPVALLSDPPIPQEPAEERREAAPSHDGNGADALLEDPNETDHEYDDGADVLDDDGGIGDQRPKFVGLQARVPLQVLEEGGLIGIVIRVCIAFQLANIHRPWSVEWVDLHDCFTQRSFFHVLFRLRLRLRLPSSCSRRRRERKSRRPSLTLPPLPKLDGRLGGEAA
jgi:hypothetical protein